MMHAISSYRQLFRSVCDSCFHRLQQQQQRRRPAQLGRTFFSSASVRHAWRLKIDSPAARANPQLYYVPKDQYIASQCVSKLLERATVQDALEYLTALRVDLQSTAAWNLILKALAREGKANQADKCFVQMRKRGHFPNEQTFTILLTAYRNSTTPSAVDRAEKRIKQMQQRYGIEPNRFHYHVLLSIYEKAGKPTRSIRAKMESLPWVPLDRDSKQTASS